MLVATVVAALLSFAACVAPTCSALWPQPSFERFGHQPVQIKASNFEVTLPSDAPEDLRVAAARIQREILSSNMQSLTEDFGASRWADVRSATSLQGIRIDLPPNVSSLRAAVAAPLKGYDESYHLTIPADGRPATVASRTSLGALRGLTTFQQLVFSLPQDGSHYIWNAPYHIQDQPAYPYRGFLLDTARNFYSVEDIERTLDTMSFVKLNQVSSLPSRYRTLVS